MIVVSPPRLLRGISNSLEQNIIPQVPHSYLRGQGYAAVELLRNALYLWDSFTDLYRTDNRAIARLLRRWSKEDGSLARKIQTALAEVDLSTRRYDTARRDNILLRALLNEVLVALDEQGQQGSGKHLRKAIRRHLKEQLLRELKMESQNAMGRMSKG